MSGEHEWDIPEIAHEIGLRRLGAQDIQAFWKQFAAVHGPGLQHGSLYSRWRVVADDLVISLYITNRSVGLFVRGQRGERYATTARRLSAYEPGLGQALGAALHDHEPLCYLISHRTVTTDTRQWPAAFEWLLAAERRYESVLRETCVGG